jgi:hypothetical protein
MLSAFVSEDPICSKNVNEAMGNIFRFCGWESCASREWLRVHSMTQAHSISVHPFTIISAQAIIISLDILPSYLSVVLTNH